ncbi:SMP-30/gluconolactonase/LRE family protein, partial [Pseudomonas syringae pv. tagetis]
MPSGREAGANPKITTRRRIMDFSTPSTTADQSRRSCLKKSLAVSATVAAIG